MPTSTPTTPERRWLKTRDAADYLGVSPKTLAKWRAERTGPPCKPVGTRMVVYRLDLLDEWIEGQPAIVAEA